MTCRSASSAPASAASAWASACARRRWPRSRSSSAGIRSAGCGARTPIRAPRAMCPRTSTRSRLPPVTGGRAATRPRRRSSTTSRTARPSTASTRTCTWTPRCRPPSSTPSAAAGRCAPRTAASTSSTCWSPPAASSPGRRTRRSRESTTSRGRPFTPPSGTTTVDLAGKRVAVIGTGASAIQFVPEIAPEAAQTTIYQRSAPWIVAQARPLLCRLGADGVPPLPGACRRQPRGVFRLLRDGHLWLHGQALGIGAVQARRQPGARADARPRPRAGRQGHARLRARVQAGPVHQRLVSDAAARRRRAAHRRDRAHHPARSARQRRRRARGRRDHLRHRLSQPQLRRPDAGHRARRP